MYQSRPFDYAAYLVEKLHEGFLNIKDNRNPTFKFYSLLMHLVLLYGHMKGFWQEDLKLNTMNREGEEQSMQLWTSLWDSWYMRSNYIKFKELIVKPLYMIYGVPCEGSISDGIKRFLRPKDCDERQIVDHNVGIFMVF